MAVFNFGGKSADSTNPEALVKAAKDGGVRFGGGRPASAAELDAARAAADAKLAAVRTPRRP
ncbi:hypothetical protein [Streptomyces sp. NBC_01500]|uniref:hypothetical protein n=1 Tax=Streptomyces sp. NBC_01500 TaxID=2903886 RepID=UPI002251FE9C|nr:hypothetical protein [Streptomyces sp. NBC_01500]MCX4549260.1 hypothetical protein [Streptomyces sp. NBC_01500]